MASTCADVADEDHLSHGREGLQAWSAEPPSVAGLPVPPKVRASCRPAWQHAKIGYVGELMLTEERRAELAALLDDERRLDADYPRVADYLDVALKLPGTGDAAADSAFDLRLVHFITGGKSVSVNPYWDIVAPSVFEHNGRRVVNGGNPKGSGRLAYAEMTLQSTYAYAIPSPETVGWIADFCGQLPVVELGAGRGYWAAQLENVGLAVSAYDIEPPGETENSSFPSAGRGESVWHPVAGIDDFDASVQADSVLFLCWPPGWGSTMASQALANFERAGGSKIVFIGEPKGGKTGDDAFFDGLTARWQLESQDVQFVSWWNLNDVAQGWVRK